MLQPRGGGGDCVVGVSWNNYQEERWAKFDEPAIKDAVEAGGGSYISNDAKSSAETQASNVENLISQGANVLIILAQDGTAIKPSVQSAIDQGVPVIAYDRLIEDDKALYITFDNVEVGRLQAEAIFGAVPKGNYVIIKGNKADANADFLRSGMDKVIADPVAAGDIKIVGETYTDNWDPGEGPDRDGAVPDGEQQRRPGRARRERRHGRRRGRRRSRRRASPGRFRCRVRTATRPRSTASPSAPRPCRCGRTPASSARPLATRPSSLCANPDAASVQGTAPFTTPGGIDVTSILLKPQPITQDNLNVVIDAGWTTKDNVCKDVAAGTVAACG